MSETPTPIKGQTKRRGLALPPRGQTLARLQDLEQDLEENTGPATLSVEELTSEEEKTEASNAVITASSNAVIHEGSKSLLTESPSDTGAATPIQAAVTDVSPSVSAPRPETIISSPTVSGTGHYPQVQVPREPTTRITVDMPDSLHRKISLLSADTRRSIKALVIEALSATYFGPDEHNT